MSLCALIYRDRSGNEVDLIVERGRELAAIEVKSGQTVTRDYFRSLNRFAGICGDQVKSGGVVYRGHERQPRSDWEVWPIRDLGALSEKIFADLAD